MGGDIRLKLDTSLKEKEREFISGNRGTAYLLLLAFHVYYVYYISYAIHMISIIFVHYTCNKGAGVAQLVQWLGCRLDNRGSTPGRGQEIFLFSTVSRRALGSTQTDIQWVPGALSIAIKWQVHEAAQSPPSSTDITNGVSIPPFPHMAL